MYCKSTIYKTKISKTQESKFINIFIATFFLKKNTNMIHVNNTSLSIQKKILWFYYSSNSIQNMLSLTLKENIFISSLQFEEIFKFSEFFFSFLFFFYLASWQYIYAFKHGCVFFKLKFNIIFKVQEYIMFRFSGLLRIITWTRYKKKKKKTLFKYSDLYCNNILMHLK